MNPHRSEPITFDGRPFGDPNAPPPFSCSSCLGWFPESRRSAAPARIAAIDGDNQPAGTTERLRPRGPDSRVAASENYRVDDGLTRRWLNRQRGDTADVIACLTHGKDLPVRYTRFARHGKFNIVNCYALDRLPIDDLEALSKLSQPAPGARKPRLVRSGPALVDGGPGRCARQTVRATPAQASRWRSSIRASRNTLHPDLDRLTDPRVRRFREPYSHGFAADENGHGTHVAGIVAGTGQPDAKYAGIAPGVSVLSLKVLDDDGKGSIGNIIAAMDWVATNHKRYNIRVVNMSVGAGVYESYWTDPLTLAAKALVDQGVDRRRGGRKFWEECGGRSAVGRDYGPRRRAVGADGLRLQHRRHARRADDTLASFSSSGPTAYRLHGETGYLCSWRRDRLAGRAREQPVRGRRLALPSWLLTPGSSQTGYAPYLSLTRHEPGGAVRDRHGGADAAGQPEPDAEPDQGHSAVHGHDEPDVSPLRQGGAS